MVAARRGAPVVRQEIEFPTEWTMVWNTFTTSRVKEFEPVAGGCKALRRRISSRLVNTTELQVRPRDFENDVLAAFDQSHPSVPVSVRPTDRLEFDIDLEERTVSTDERTL